MGMISETRHEFPLVKYCPLFSFADHVALFQMSEDFWTNYRNVDKFFKMDHTFSIESMNIGGNLGPKIFITQKVSILFSSKNFLIFDFFGDLEIAETFENAITDALIRSPNLRLKKYGQFFKICPDIPKSQ